MKPSGKVNKGNRRRSTGGSSRSNQPTNPGRLRRQSSKRGGSNTSSSYVSNRNPIRPTPGRPTAAIQSKISNSTQDDAEEDVLEEIVMALEMHDKGTIGCSYYVARDETLYFMEDIQMGTNDLIEQLKLFVSPTVVLLSTRAVDDTIKCFDPHFHPSANESRNDPFNLPFSLEFRPPAEFGYDAAKFKLINLRIGALEGPNVYFEVPGDEEYANASERCGHQAQMMKLSSLVSLEGRITVGCAGAILAYLQRRRAAAYLPGDPAANALFRISAVSMFNLKNYMFITADTILSLQILHSESHPSSHNQGPTKADSGSKEGLSVYGLFHHLVKSPQGRIALRRLFLRPIKDSKRINERLDTVSVFSRPENATLLNTLRRHMGNIKNVRSLVIMLRRGATAGSGQAGRIAIRVWSSLHKFACHSVLITESLGDIAGFESLEVSRSFSMKFRLQAVLDIGRKISEIIDFDASAEQQRTVVRQGVDSELDHRKHTYQGIESLLAEVANELQNESPNELLQDLKAVYLPQIGFLVALPKDKETAIAQFEGAESDSWEQMFSGDGIIYYKNDQMRHLDQHFGDLFTDICDREIEIIHELALDVLKYEDSLIAASDLCADLDCFLALAEGAKRYNFCRPKLTQENIVNIKGGRHPLQELTVSTFIPNDTYLSCGGESSDDASDCNKHTTSMSTSDYSHESKNSIVVLTGPNFSGKSVFLKQVAIIVYLTHIGCFIPASQATVGITDKILLRIATRDSVSRSQSAFLVDLQQVSMAVNLASSRSLLVIDEFGKGTASYDGAGLVGGLIEYFSTLARSKQPKVLAATHFHEVFERGLTNLGPSASFAHMEIRLDGNTEVARRQVTYLYNLQPGLSSASFGTVCAAMNGIDEEIIKRAEELTLLATKGGDLMAACATLNKSEVNDLQVAERNAREFLARNIRDDPRTLLKSVLHASLDDVD